MTTFKEITHFHIGCLMQSVVDGQRFTHTVPWDSNNSHYKPILIPMDKMSEADAKEFLLKVGDRYKFHYDEVKDWLIDGAQPLGIIISAAEMADGIALLLSKHYNVFNLPPEEFIDATGLTPNPYEV
jgi:hypothetical protein